MDAKDIKFSVVLPCYNVEKYIAECLDSLVNQTYPNLEIICVNDGSTDGTLQVIESYIAKDNRIQVVTQHNQGLGQTRTNGMQYATGDYIAFFDPDDSTAYVIDEAECMDIDTADDWRIAEIKYKIIKG